MVVEAYRKNPYNHHDTKFQSLLSKSNPNTFQLVLNNRNKNYIAPCRIEFTPSEYFFYRFYRYKIIEVLKQKVFKFFFLISHGQCLRRCIGRRESTVNNFTLDDSVFFKLFKFLFKIPKTKSSTLTTQQIIGKVGRKKYPNLKLDPDPPLLLDYNILDHIHLM